MKIKPIEEKLKPILNAFLDSPELQENFKSKARRLGYTGDDKDKIRVALFTPDQEGNICFADDEVEDMFLIYQIRIQTASVEPYKTLLQQYPESEQALIDISKRILKGEKVDQQEILNLFPITTE